MSRGCTLTILELQITWDVSILNENVLGMRQYFNSVGERLCKMGCKFRGALFKFFKLLHNSEPGSYTPLTLGRINTNFYR